MKLSALGEFGLIDRIRQRVGEDALTRRGIGDDCAQSRLPEGEELLTSTDMLLEGVHFRLDWTDPRSLGRKAVAVNVSDIAAMGGTPRWLFLGLALPATATAEAAEAFAAGVVEEAAAYGVTLVGGDTCRSPGPWVLSLTVQGTAPAGQALGRDGARPGDLLAVSGTLGDSALALQQLLRGEAVPAALAQRHHRPQARVALGRALAETGLATALIDLSDGLAADLGHIAELSGVGARVALERLPLSAAFTAAGGTAELALTGGEDYELLFSLPADRRDELAALAARLALPLTVIGAIGEAPGLYLTANGQPRPWPARGGFDHFA